MAVDDDLEFGEPRCPSTRYGDIRARLLGGAGGLPEDRLSAAPDARHHEL